MILFLLASISLVSANESNISDYTGTWELKMTSEFSTCTSTKVDDVNVKQIIVSLQSDKLTAIEPGEVKLSPYVGRLHNSEIILLRQIGLNSGLKKIGMKYDHQAVIKVSGNSSKLSGKRIVSNALDKKTLGPCTIIYDVSMRKL